MKEWPRVQDWENFKDRRSLIFLTGRILGDLLSAGGGLVLWTYGCPRLGKVSQNMDRTLQCFSGEHLGDNERPAEVLETPTPQLVHFQLQGQPRGQVQLVYLVPGDPGFQRRHKSFGI